MERVEGRAASCEAVDEKTTLDAHGDPSVAMESHGGRSSSLQLSLELTGDRRGRSILPAMPFRLQSNSAAWSLEGPVQGGRPVIAQFGLDQLKRREEGKITAQQHLAQNMDFIKQATERRLARLNERMAKE